MASGWLGKPDASRTRPPDVQVQLVDREPNNFYLPSSNRRPPSPSSALNLPPPGAVDTTHSRIHVQTASLFDVGIFKDTLVPSLTLHSGLAVIAWGAARYTGRVEAKDWLWSSGQVLNAWWSAVGRKLYQGLTLYQVFHRLSWHERLVLTGVTLWGGRLFYRISRRSLKRGTDDPRYDEAKQEDDFWTKSLFTTFIPEAFFQMLISLPFTAPFRHDGAVLTGYHPYIQMAAVGLFSAGFALESLADYQLDQYKAEGKTGILKEGVWSIVRHPNYLGDTLIHASFVVLLYGSDMLAPIELLGPIANYLYLRLYGGDKQKERTQTRRYSASEPEKFAALERFRADKNAFWPRVQEASNPWLWTVLSAGCAGVLLEEGLRLFH